MSAVTNPVDTLPSLNEEDENFTEIINNAWSVKLNHEFPAKVYPFQQPRFKQAIEFVPLTFR